VQGVGQDVHLDIASDEGGRAAAQEAVHMTWYVFTSSADQVGSRR
jgi:hypothetical protein